MKVLPHTRSCFVCGESNPAGLKLRFHTDGRVVQTRFTPRPEHIGFKASSTRPHHHVAGRDHGLGVRGADEAVRVLRGTQRAVFESARPDEEVTATGELTANQKNKISRPKRPAKSIRLVLAEATGKYLPIKTNDIKAMAGDFVDDPSWLFE